ncbi:MAG: hypothetical protein EOO20_16735, partial [Chryseobacterium sp.]
FRRSCQIDSSKPSHQTYFADVIMFLHIFCAIKWRKQNRQDKCSHVLLLVVKKRYIRICNLSLTKHR